MLILFRSYIDFVDLLDDKTNVRLFYKLIGTYPQSIHLEDLNRNTLLHHAVKKMNKLAVMVLLEYESNPWKESKESENTLKMYKHTSYEQKTQRVNLLELLKTFSFYDAAFVNEELLEFSMESFSENFPLATFVLNQPQTVFELDKRVKLSDGMKKMAKAKK